jgi:hypothetical protein
MNVTYLPKTEIWIATEPRTDLRLLKLAADNAIAMPGEPVAKTLEIRVPVVHVLAVGDTAAIAEDRGRLRARRGV